MIQVVLAVSGKFHTFDLARQLERFGALTRIFSGYPRWKLRAESLPQAKIWSFPALYLSYNVVFQLTTNRHLRWGVNWLCNQGIDAFTAAFLPPCDVFMAIAANGLQAGRKAQRRGGVYICDRPCSHIRYQERILHEEYERQGLQFEGIDPRVIAKEEAEYAQADMVVVGSSFAQRSFQEMGFPLEKVRCIPYGVDLSMFHPVGEPDPDEFSVLFVGAAAIRKGISYLLEGFAALDHPRKRLTFVGGISPEVKVLIDRTAETQPVTCLGHMPQMQLKGILSRSHVLVLPSVEDGFGLVMAEAMACGCPVIASTNTGSEDLFEDGVHGFIVPIRDSAAITQRLQQLADDPDLRGRMAAAGLAHVRASGGWNRYGDTMVALMKELVEAKQGATVTTLSLNAGRAASAQQGSPS